MKRSFALLLLVVLVLSTTVMAAAEPVAEKKVEPKITEEKAIELAEEVIEKGWRYTIEDDNNAPEVTYQNSQVNFVNDYYIVYWDMTKEDPSLSIKVAIDAETGFAKYAYYNDNSTYPQFKEDETIEMFSDAEAKKMAEDFAKKMFPDKYKEVELVSSNIKTKFSGYIEYSYLFYRKVNDAYVSNNYIKVNLYSDTKDISSYYCQWYDLEFKSTENTINKYQAIQAVKDVLPLSLIYKPVYNLTDYTTDLYLTVYDSLPDKGYALDALTGDLIDINGQIIDTTSALDLTPEEKSDISANEIGLKDYEDPISKERAKELVNKYIEDIYGTGYTVTSLILVDESNETITGVPYKWHAIFENNTDNEVITTGQIKVNALTERLLLATINNATSSEDSPELSWEQGYEKAIEVIKNYYPDKINDIKTEIPSNNDTLEYIFSRTINETLYFYNGIAVSFDETSKAIKQISFTWEDTSDMKTPKVINKAIAIKNYFNEYDPDMYYVMINTSKDMESPNFELKLVYDLPKNYYDSNVIDAVNGELIDKDCNLITNSTTTPFEAEQLMTKFEALSILLDEKSDYYKDLDHDLKYDELLFTDLNDSSKYYDVVRDAYMLGIIENTATEFKGDEYITREELAEILVKRLGFNKVAELKNVYRLTIADQNKISSDKYGYVALAYGFGILQTDNAKLQPQESVTKLDLYIAINNLENVLNFHLYY